MVIITISMINRVNGNGAQNKISISVYIIVINIVYIFLCIGMYIYSRGSGYRRVGQRKI